MSKDVNLTRSEKLRMYWSLAISRKEEQRISMTKHNPMRLADVRKKFDNSVAKFRGVPLSIETRKKMSAAWTTKRRKDHAKRMKAGSFQQITMQQNGNARRRPNLGARRWFKTLSPKLKRCRSERLSQAISLRFKGVKRYPKGLQGYIETRFGRLRYDSSWEASFITSVQHRSDVIKISRDIVVPYTFQGSKHNFLVDFFVEFSKGSPILVEIKCPYFLGKAKEKTKVRAARRYAKKHNLRFVLLASKEQAKEGCLCPKS